MTKSAISSELAGKEARHSVEMNWRRGLSTTAENDWKSVSVVVEPWAGMVDDMEGSAERVDWLWGEGGISGDGLRKAIGRSRSDVLITRGAVLVAAGMDGMG